jgi:hypothetical protein
MDGSIEYPYIIIVNPDRPEANWGFEVTPVQGIEHRNFNRNAFHIRKTTVTSQEGKWSAEIPHCYPSMKERVMRIKGPSQSFWHQTATRYHSDPEYNCSNTKKAHLALEDKITSDPSRSHSYWLIVFPKGITLENYIFSDDAIHVKTESMDLVGKTKLTTEEDEGSDDDDDDDDDDEVEIWGQEVYWRMAMSGGDRLRSPDRKAARKKRFGSRTATVFSDAKEGRKETKKNQKKKGN